LLTTSSKATKKQLGAVQADRATDRGAIRL
jgi:hypothetical protein